MVVITEYFMTVYVFAFVGSSTAFGIGAFLFFLTAIKDLEENLKSIDEHAKSKEEEHSKISEQITGFIRKHSVVQE